MDWNIYGRTGSLFVRVYEEEEVLNVHVAVDVSRSMDWGEPNKLAYARKVAAALGYVALSSSNRLSVWALDATGGFGPAWGRQRATALMSFLDALHPAQQATPDVIPLEQPSPPDIAGSLGQQNGRSAGLTIFLSDLLSPTWDLAIANLAARPGELVVLHVLSPQELRPELGGDVRLIDRETGAAVSVTLNNDAIRLYGQRLDEWRRKVETFCSKRGATYVPVDTGVGAESLVFDTLRRRGVVR